MEKNQIKYLDSPQFSSGLTNYLTTVMKHALKQSKIFKNEYPLFF